MFLCLRHLLSLLQDLTTTVGHLARASPNACMSQGSFSDERESASAERPSVQAPVFFVRKKGGGWAFGVSGFCCFGLGILCILCIEIVNWSFLLTFGIVCCWICVCVIFQATLGSDMYLEHVWKHVQWWGWAGFVPTIVTNCLDGSWMTRSNNEWTCSSCHNAHRIFRYGWPYIWFYIDSGTSWRSILKLSYFRIHTVLWRQFKHPTNQAHAKKKRSTWKPIAQRSFWKKHSPKKGPLCTAAPRCRVQWEPPARRHQRG